GVPVGFTRLTSTTGSHFGVWRSLVAHLTGGQGVAGSNPVSPTEENRRSEAISATYRYRRYGRFSARSPYKSPYACRSVDRPVPRRSIADLPGELPGGAARGCPGRPAGVVRGCRPARGRGCH